MAIWDVIVSDPRNPEIELTRFQCKNKAEIVERINSELEERGIDRKVTISHLNALASTFKHMERYSTVQKFKTWIKLEKHSASSIFGM